MPSRRAVTVAFLAFAALTGAAATFAGARSPGGTILFGLHTPGGRDHFFALAPDGTNTRTLPFPTAGCAGCLRLSPDGRRVLFAGSGNRKRVTTAAANVNGTGYRAFRLPDRTLNLGPGEWSPDGRRIAFEGWDDSRASRNGLYTGSSADGGRLRRLTSSTGGSHDVPLQYSPNGFWILLARTRPVDGAEAADLYVVRTDGTRLQKLNRAGTTVNWSFGSPASWSRDSRTIAFAAFDSRSNDPGRSAVFTVAPTGADLRRIIRWGQWITSGRFSPDGHWIAFDRLPGHDLFLMHANGSGLRKIVSATSSGIGSCCAVWSPDSTHLLFQRGDAGTATLWTVKADGTELTQLTTLPGRYEAYSWGP